MGMLHDKFAAKLPQWREEKTAVLKGLGEQKISEVTVAQAFGGMRGVKGMICDTSLVEPDSGLIIRGFIPYYPGNGGPRFIDNNASLNEFYDPELLVTAASPPCLIFQGSADALVPPMISERFKAAYTAAGNQICALMELPLAGHAGDIFFSGYYSTFFLYYMERFMYLYR